MTLRFHRVTTLLLVSFALGGCSVLIDSSKYTGDAVDSGVPMDGEVRDGDVPPDGDLRDGELPDGELPNRPPVLSSVGLSTYMPLVGDSIRATPGPVSDPDGDTTLIRYQWFRNDTAIVGATTGLLSTSTLAAGDLIRIEAWAYDGELESAHVHAGPVSLEADTTRWRPVAPGELTTQTSSLSPVVYDEPNRRYVRFGSQLLWEYTVDAAGMLRVVPIPVRGSGPPDEQFIVIHDPEGHRAFALHDSSTSVAYVIDLSRRGGETWVQVPIDGIPPPLRIGAATSYDPAQHRIMMYGGFSGTETVRISPDLWTLDVRPGQERWQQIALGGTATPPALFGATMAADPTTPGSWILAGGGDFVSAGTLAMYRLTPGTDDTATLEELVALMPASSFGTSSATDVVNNRIVFAGGGVEIDSGAFGVAIFDPAAGTFVRPSAPMLAEGILGLLDPDPDVPGRFVLFRGYVNSRSAVDVGFDLRAIDATTGEASIIVHEDRPPGLSEAAMSPLRSSSATLIGGKLDDGTANPVVYSLNLGNYTWSTVTTMGDAVDGSSPVPRYGTMIFDSSPWTGLQYFGGWVADGVLADSEVWELVGTRWLHRTLRMGSPPAPRRGAAYVASGACGADQNYVYGGEGAAGPLADANSLICDLGDRTRDCYWQEKASGGSAPLGREWATLGVDNASTAWLVGGREAAGDASMTNLHNFNVCSGGPSPWTRVTVSSATSPSPRHGHSMLFDRPDSGGLSSYVVFGGTNTTGAQFDDVWRLEIVSTTGARWVEIVPGGTLRPEPRAFHQAVWDDSGSRMVVFGGRGDSGTLGDVWELVIRP